MSQPHEYYRQCDTIEQEIMLKRSAQSCGRSVVAIILVHPYTILEKFVFAKFLHLQLLPL